LPISAISIIVEYINNNFQKKLSKNEISKTKKKYYKRSVTSNEFLVFLGMFIFSETKFSDENHSFEKIFKILKKKLKSKQLPIGQKRFQAILNSLTLDNYSISTILDILRNSWKENFTPNEKVVIDESIWEFQPKCLTKKKWEKVEKDPYPGVYFPNKPHKNGKQINFKQKKILCS